jgi:hypothetical protein
MAMTFRKATDDLFVAVSHDELAEKIGCSVPSIRQARRDEDSASYRTPPKEWEMAVLDLAEKQIAHFTRLASRLRTT